MRNLDLESLREIFKDDRSHIAIGQIKKLMMASDRSVLRAMISLLPDQKEIVAKMSWDELGDGAGDVTLPSVNDLVLLAFADGADDHAYVIKKLSNREDKIPVNAVNGDSVKKSLPGKKIWITSDSRINLSIGDDQPTENLVLGQVLKTFLSEVLTLIINHTHVGNLGYQTSAPVNASDFSDLKDDPVDNEGILSDLAFTEKGE